MLRLSIDIQARMEEPMLAAAALLRELKSKRTLPLSVSVQEPDTDEDGVSYSRVDFVKGSYNSVDAVHRQFEQAAAYTYKACKEHGWLAGLTRLTFPDGHTETIKLDVPRPSAAMETPTVIALPPLDYEPFRGLYGMEHFIRLIYDSADAARRTAFEERHHVLLWSEDPATGKSSLLLRFVEWFGDKLVWRVDSGTMTKAGLERELLDRAEAGTLRPFLLIEEVEKGDEKNLNCLLQVMDMRGRIQRTNARDGDRWAWCKVVVWMTCNNRRKLEGFQEGALLSRLPVELHFHRPDQATMYKILAEHVLRIGGKVEWVDRVVDFMYQELSKSPGFSHKWNDPRVGMWMLSGGDRLLDAGPTGFLADFRKAVLDPNFSGLPLQGAKL